jgi:transposase
LQLFLRGSLSIMVDMKAYSLDLRERIVRAYAQHLGSQRALASLFAVSLSFVEKLLRRHRTTGESTPRPHAGGRSLTCDGAAQALIRQLVQAQPDATLEELCAQLQQQQGLRVSVATMARLLPRLGLPRKKSRSMRRNGTRPASNRRGPRTGR